MLFKKNVIQKKFMTHLLDIIIVCFDNSQKS